MSDYPARLTIELPSDSSIPDSAVYIAILGKDPGDSEKFGYLDFETSTLKASWTTGSFQLDPAVMVKSLAEIKSLNGGYVVPVPAINSGRIYFSFNDNFSSMPGFGPAGFPFLRRR